jgi:hypothetical protein
MTTPADDVDRIVDAWSRERPDLDITPLEVLSRVTRIAKRVDKYRREAFKASRLESWEFDVLAALRRAGKPLPTEPQKLDGRNSGQLGGDDASAAKTRGPGFHHPLIRPG